ncbi:MAG: hypothetical protein QMD50_00120 [Patescibacteria group bacterium]|nr:hypothetical protein [Patescibacteria group bacterium]
MTFRKFADVMEKIGFGETETVEPFVKLDSKILANPAMKNGYTKPEGTYRVISMYSQKIKGKDHVALWIRRITNPPESRIYPLFAEEVDFLVKRNCFKKEKL